MKDTTRIIQDLRHVLLNKISVTEHIFRNIESSFRDIERQMKSVSEAIIQCNKLLEDKDDGSNREKNMREGLM